MKNSLFSSSEDESNSDSSEDKGGGGRSQPISVKNSGTKMIPKKKAPSEEESDSSGSEKESDSSGSEEESSEDDKGGNIRSQPVSVKNSNTEKIPKNNGSESYQIKSGSGSASKSPKDGSQALIGNLKRAVSETFRTNAGSGSPPKPKTEFPDLKPNVPVKRQFEEMDQDHSETKRKLRLGREVASLIKTEGGYRCGLDEITLSQIWDREVDRKKRRELEVKLMKVRETQFTLYVEQAQFVAEATKLIVDALRKRH